jgi:hypothetical protein
MTRLTLLVIVLNARVQSGERVSGDGQTRLRRQPRAGHKLQ